MEPISFEEFKEKLKDESDIELRGMARDINLELPPRILRETLLKRLFDASDLPKKPTPVEAAPIPAKSSPTKQEPPGVVYQVALKAAKNRWRGGYLWRTGVTEIPEKMMSKPMLLALEGDKDFRVRKVKIEE